MLPVRSSTGSATVQAHDTNDFNDLLSTFPLSTKFIMTDLRHCYFGFLLSYFAFAGEILTPVYVNASEPCLCLAISIFTGRDIAYAVQHVFLHRTSYACSEMYFMISANLQSTLTHGLHLCISSVDCLVSYINAH